ncbi:MAG: hypothetical protein LBJ87_06025, partial [bacterium]|nr:hypothetical protein [bacterium]
MPRFLHHEGESGGRPPADSHPGIHFPDHHGDLDDGGEESEGTPLTWDLDNVELTTVGVDVGS